MPTQIGGWTYVTQSSDPDLNGKQGFVSCVASGLPGLLKADSCSKKWKFTNGPYAIPLSFRIEAFFDPASSSEFITEADFLKNQVKGYMFDTRLTNQEGWFGGSHDYIFSGSWQNHEFDLVGWDRMEARMEILSQRGLWCPHYVLCR